MSDRQYRTSKIKMHFARVSYSPKHRYRISVIFMLNTPWLVIFFIYKEFLINLIQFKLENLSFDFRRTFFYHLIIELVLKLLRKSRSNRFKDKIIKKNFHIRKLGEFTLLYRLIFQPYKLKMVFSCPQLIAIIRNTEVTLKTQILLFTVFS